MDLTLERSTTISPVRGPVLLVVMDGVGIGRHDGFDAVHLARTPTLEQLREASAYRTLKAHGTAVGLPSDADMGNSEVGHNALGAGRIIDQGAKLVNEAIESGSIFQSDAWQTIQGRCTSGGTLHLIGLLSDGNVHSHEDHLHALLRAADRDGFAAVRVHALLDGRDVPETSALTYVDRLDAVLAEINAKPERDYRVASGGGRMVTTMDRYEADWRVVERGWNAHVHGEGRAFASMRAAIETYRAEDASTVDQFMAPFVVADGDAPVGAMQDGDAVVFFNFRGDRALEISRAFEEGETFDAFDRGRIPDVFFAGMTLYDGDLQIPKAFLVSPPAIDRTLGEHLARNGITQFALSETQKYGHVTYFWNGNRGGMFDEALETYVEIPSDLVPFEQRPWMKAAEITDATIDALTSGEHRFLRINYANGDMVGHTGDLEATVIAVEAVDLCLGRLREAIDRVDGALIVLADHGNADEMVQREKDGTPKVEDGHPKRRTSHSLNPVPCYLYRADGVGIALRDDLPDAGLANVAATVLELLGFTPPTDYEPSLLAHD